MSERVERETFIGPDFDLRLADGFAERTEHVPIALRLAASGRENGVVVSLEGRCNLVLCEHASEARVANRQSRRRVLPEPSSRSSLSLEATIFGALARLPRSLRVQRHDHASAHHVGDGGVGTG